MVVDRYIKQTARKENTIRKKVIANDCQYFNVFAAEITEIRTITANKYSKIAKSDFHIFIEGHDVNNSI